MSEINYQSAEIVYREAAEGAGILEGRMVPYGEWTEINSPFEGHFMERMMPGALAKTFKERGHRLRVLFEHGVSKLLDKQSIAAIEEVREEPDGAYFRAQLLEGLPPLLLSGLKRGLYATSIGMKPVKSDINRRPGKSEHNPDGIEERSVTEAYLREFSIVSFPAYAGATAMLRTTTDDLIRSIVREYPGEVLQIVREQVATEPEHSEPADPDPDQEDPAEGEEPDTGSRPTQPEDNKPTKDWLAPTEETKGWLIP